MDERERLHQMLREEWTKLNAHFAEEQLAIEQWETDGGGAAIGSNISSDYPS